MHANTLKLHFRLPRAVSRENVNLITLHHLCKQGCTYFRVGVVAGSGAAVVLELAVADAKRVGGVLGVDTPRVVHLVPDEAWQAVGWAGGGVHGGDGRPRLRVFVHHDGC